MEQQGNKVDMKLRWAILPLLVMIGVMLVAIVQLKQGPHIPLIIGTAVAALVAWRHGYKWKEIEEMMYKGIRLALPAVVIIILVGLTIGAWIGGGVVATMIYYGLTIISPAYFLVTICIICAVVALSIGSSWSTMGTIGVAGMGIGLSMGIPAPMVAGAWGQDVAAVGYDELGGRFDAYGPIRPYPSHALYDYPGPYHCAWRVLVARSPLQ